MPALRKAISSVPSETFAYPTGMVWCPMKMSGMAIMRCARLQKDLGCGTRRALQTLRATNPERAVLFWPWLRRQGECPERATEKAGSRDPTGNNPTEASRAQPEESADLPVLRVRRSQDIRRPSVPPMLAYLREEIGLTV